MKNCNGHFMEFYGKIQFLEVEKECIIYSGKTINWHSQNSLHYISHLIFTFCVNIVWIHIHIHIWFLFRFFLPVMFIIVVCLHLMLLKLMFIALFQYTVFCHDGVLCEWHCALSIYVSIFSSACGKAVCDELLVHHVAFSSPPAFGGYQCITKVLR